MKVKIAVFGRMETIKSVKETAESEFENIEILPFTYSHAKDTESLIERAFMCDVYLFSEPLSYMLVQKKISKKKLPSVFVHFDAYSVLSCLHRLSEGNDKKIDRISIDILDRGHAVNGATEFGLHKEDVHVYSMRETGEPDIDNISQFHKQLWEDDKIDIVITSSREVESHMVSADIPVCCMDIPKKNISEALAEAKSLIEISQNKSTQLVTGFIQIKDSEALAEDDEDMFKNLLYRLGQLLTEFARRTDAHIFLDEERKFVLLGTKKVLQHLQTNYRDFPLIRSIEAELNRPVSIGFGLGLTAKESGEHAFMALTRCNAEPSSLCFIVNERKDTIGPIGIRRKIDTSSLFQSLIHNARLNNELSYNFIDFITERNNEPFSSNDIAAFYKVTKRSAERTVNKLLTGNVIKITGEERPYLKGRPRKLFTLNQ